VATISYNLTVNKILSFPKIPQNIVNPKSRFKTAGKLHLTIHGAKNLGTRIGVDKADPYCFVKFGNSHFRTRTVEDDRNPVWNREFDFDIPDLYSNLTISVYDEDLSNNDDFLGNICIPVLDMKNGEQIDYQLKSKYLDDFLDSSIDAVFRRMGTSA